MEIVICIVVGIILLPFIIDGLILSTGILFNKKTLTILGIILVIVIKLLG